MPEQVIEKRETEMVVSPPGMDEGSTAGALDDIFSKIETAKSEGRSVEEALKPEERPAEKPAETPKQEVEKPSENTQDSDLSKRLDEVEKKKQDDAEVSREKLRADTEEKKVEEPKKVDEVKKEEEVPESELQVLPHDKPKTAKRIQALLKKVDEVTQREANTKKEKDAQASELADLKKKLSEVKTVDPATDEKIKAQLDELAMYRRRYELDKDPEVKSKFDSRVEQSEKSISDLLTRHGAGQRMLELIKEEGGWVKFTQSGRVVPVKDPDSETGYKNVTLAEIAEQALEALPFGDRKAIEAAMVEQFNTARDRDRYFKEQQEQAVGYFKKKDEEAAKQNEEYQKQVEHARKQIDDLTGKVLQSEWMKDREVPATATPQEKAAIEEHNKYNSQLRSLFKQSIATKDIPGLVDIVADSVRYYDERRTSSLLRKENEKLKSELQAKQAEIDKFRGASRSVPKSGSISTPSSSERPKNDMPKSLEEAFERLERGESLTTVTRDEE